MKLDENNLEVLIEEYSNLIFNVSYNLLNNRELAKECLNDVLFKIYNNIKRYDYNKGNMKNWICTITKNTAIDMLRKEKKNYFNLELKDNIKWDNEVEDLYENKETLGEVVKILKTLSKRDRLIFHKRYVLGESLKEVAYSMNLSEKFIGQRISRCRKKIKKMVNINID